MFDLRARLTSWPTTTFGLAIAAGWTALAQTLPPGCKEALGRVETYGPAVLVAVVGALLKGPSKTDGVIATTSGPIPPPVEKVK